MCLFHSKAQKSAAVPGVAVIFHSLFVLPQQSKASGDIGKLRFVPKQSLMTQVQFESSKLRSHQVVCKCLRSCSQFDGRQSRYEPNKILLAA